MSKRLICLVSVLLVLNLAGAASAELVAHWPLDGDYADATGNGHDGTPLDSPRFVDDAERGMVFEADGSARAMVADAPDLNYGANESVTMTVWALYDPALYSSGWKAIVVKGRTGPGGDTSYVDRLYGFYVNGGGLWHMNAGFGGGNSISAVPGEWHHLAFVQDGPGNVGYFFIDLVERNTGSAADCDTTGRPLFIGAAGTDASNVFEPFGGRISDVRIYNEALLGEALAATTEPLAPPGSATDPSPANKATDVPRDVVLSWVPGQFAPTVNGHIVYFSESFSDVSEGVGGVTLSAASYALPQRLDFNTTYYWRVDEVNAPPDTTVFPGEVWSFTTEPVAYPIENVTATASSSETGKGPENTVNGSGLDVDDLHSKVETDMWLSLREDNAAWIQYEFEKVHKLYQMLVWNHNTGFELTIGFGIKEAVIEYSVDGSNWTTLGTTHEFAQATGLVGYASNTMVDFDGAVAKYVKITANSNWGGLVNQFGLSEVRFLSIPVSAREPSPDSGALDVNPDVTLSWRTGREAATHNLYLSSDEQAVIDGTAPLVNPAETSYSTALDLGGTYYWRVDEVNEAETPATWTGEVWSFSTSDYLVVDDFESYNDIDPPDPKSHRIFESWIDGFGVSTNGALVGLDPPQPSYTETSIVHGGRQSMPLFYSNTDGAAFSEATRTFGAPQDWTKHGIQTLVLNFRGTPDNTGQLYMKINEIKLIFDGEAGALARPLWTLWKIDLAAIGVDLQNVTTLSLGIDGAAASGVVYIDDIVLYRIAPQGTQDPGTDDLVAYYAMENDVRDHSGNGNDGTMLAGQFAQDAYKGTVLSLDGIDDVVQVPHSSGIGFNDATNLTVTLWAKPTKLPRLTWTGVITKNRDVSAGDAYGIWISTSNQWHFRVGGTSGDANIPGAPDVTGEWHFVAMTHDADATTLRGYVDGRMIHENNNSNPAPLTAQSPLWIGGAQGVIEFYPGQLDDVRIYNRVLSEDELSFVAAQ